MHIYMSLGRMDGHASKFDLNKTVLLNPRTGKPNDTMKYRGETKKGNDGKYPAGNEPESFKQMMAKSGHVVVLSEKFLGLSYLLREPTEVKDDPVADAK